MPSAHQYHEMNADALRQAKASLDLRSQRSKLESAMQRAASVGGMRRWFADRRVQRLEEGLKEIERIVPSGGPSIEMRETTDPMTPQVLPVELPSQESPTDINT